MSAAKIKTVNSLADYLRERGFRLLRSGKEFVTNACPVTAHKKPNHRPISINPEKELWFCNDCEKGGSIIDWVMYERGVTAAEAMQILSGGSNHAVIVATYNYTDATGKLLYQICRLQPKDFRVRRPDGRCGWIWGKGDARSVLYHLPAVIASQEVCVPEGEKDADNLMRLGFVATTNPFGAGKWTKSHSETLRRKDVCIFGDVGDADGKGEKHTVQRIASLSGVAKSIKNVTLPDGFHDVSDYIASLPARDAERTIRDLIDKTQFVAAETVETNREGVRSNDTSAATSKPEKGKGKKEKSASSQLVSLVVDENGEQNADSGRKFGPFSLFHDAKDRAFARYKAKNHTEIWPIESSKFRKILARLYYNNTGKIINRNALADAVTTLAGLACHDNPEEQVFLRVAPYGDNKGVIVDLCDSEWRVVLITAEGWQILDESPVAFVRTGSMQALPEPKAGGGCIKPLWDLLNVAKTQRVLVAGVILNAFHPFGPYPVTNYVGEQGSAKTCAGTMHRQLVDPNDNPLRAPPKEERDLLVQAANNWCVALDNLSYLPWWLSDGLCRIATGGGHSARTLYTDLEEISIKVKRPVILNGIEDVAKRPDLADRVVQIELEQIKDNSRIEELSLWQKFNQERPRIFTAILDAIVCALRNRDKVRLKIGKLPRMADAAIWAASGETALGFKPGTFIKAYKQNLRESAHAAVEANPVGVAIELLLEESEKWEGEPTELLEKLGALVSENVREQRSWPKNVRALGHSLRRIAPALRRAGIGYERPREAKRRIIRLRKKRRERKTSSSSSHRHFSEENSETTSSQMSHTTSSSSQIPQGNDDYDEGDDVSPTLHADQTMEEIRKVYPYARSVIPEPEPPL